MKDNPDIDELLNAYIDGELGQRQITEVHRLIAHDQDLTKRMLELKNCKTLIESMPREQAPADMAEEIRAVLERKTLLSQQSKHSEYQQGQKHLLLRNVLTVAAMIGLVAALLVVVYTIMAPQEGSEKLFVAQENTDMVNVAKGLDKYGFDGRVELKTTEPIMVTAFLKLAIENKGLGEKANLTEQHGTRVYSLQCSRKAAKSLLTEMNNIWEKFDSATLFVKAGGQQQIVVQAVTAEQISEIVSQEAKDSQIETARHFASLNDSGLGAMEKRSLLAINDGEDLIIAPMPRLTSGQDRIKKTAAENEDGQSVRLIIVIATNEEPDA